MGGQTILSEQGFPGQGPTSRQTVGGVAARGDGGLANGAPAGDSVPQNRNQPTRDPNQGQSSSEPRADRRNSLRHAVDEAGAMALLRQGSAMPCRVLNLSLDGCLIETSQHFCAGIQVRVEVSFSLNGIAFRFNGVTRWTDGRNQVGIAFVDVIPRRREALAEMLDEVEAAKAAKRSELEKAERAADGQIEGEKTPEHAESAAAAVPQPEKPAPALPGRSRTTGSMGERSDGSRPEPRARHKTEPGVAAASRPAPRERRAHRRHSVDTTAVIHMVRAGSQLRGRIQDLSASGCQIRTDERFPVGIYTRVETEFHVQGLPFRLGGVVQSIHDRERLLVGIRFLDMSERKREQLAALMEEIAELAVRKAETPAGEPDQGRPAR